MHAPQPVLLRGCVCCGALCCGAGEGQGSTTGMWLQTSWTVSGRWGSYHSHLRTNATAVRHDAASASAPALTQPSAEHAAGLACVLSDAMRCDGPLQALVCVGHVPLLQVACPSDGRGDTCVHACVVRVQGMGHVHAGLLARGFEVRDAVDALRLCQPASQSLCVLQAGMGRSKHLTGPTRAGNQPVPPLVPSTVLQDGAHSACSRCAPHEGPVRHPAVHAATIGSRCLPACLHGLQEKRAVLKLAGHYDWGLDAA